VCLSVVIPAYNEERYLVETLNGIKSAARGFDVAKVISEPHCGVGRARNTGAAGATGNILIFVDAGTLVPDRFFVRIREIMSNPCCLGGAIDTDYRPRRWLVSLYLQFWRVLGTIAGMAQGASQFCRREVFQSLGGYDQSLWTGEDVDFYWRLKKFAQRSHGRVQFIDDMRVQPSSRRFDRWPLWRILLWTNPMFIWIFQRRRAVGAAWYERAIR
jgi:glycosyltransferase involved in cell wall biosynthesis